MPTIYQQYFHQPRNVVKAYPCIPLDAELNYCPAQQIVYQNDMSQSVEYAEEYFAKYQTYEDLEIAKRINEARVAISHKYCFCLLDIGIGCGTFINQCRLPVFGYDVNATAVAWLQQRNLYLDPYQSIPDEVDGITLWDVLEHIPEPQLLFSQVKPNTYLFASLPIFPDVTRARESKHFRPNEHFYYFSESGFITFMDDSGFDFLESNDCETEAGREGILTFAFVKR